MAGQNTRSERWEERPVAAGLVRVVAFVVPIAASVASTAILSRVLPRPSTPVATAGWWIGLTAVATFVLWAVDRVARRMLPLAALLQLSLIFPDQAPNRFAVALRSGTIKNLEQRAHDVRHHGLGATPAEAAKEVIELIGALQVHDRRTRGHAERVRALADLLGEEMRLGADDRDRLRWAALLHDIGKLAVPHHILNKADKPDEAEWEILKQHPIEGERLVGSLVDWLGPWALAIGEHHERWDGGGYPRGIAGESISQAARIVAVADSYEVMTSARSYKRPMPAAAARAELARCAGAHFDPLVVRAFLNIALGKLRLAMGPLSWIAQLPFLNQVPGLAPIATGAASAAGVVVAVFAGGFLDTGAASGPVRTPVAVAAAADPASTTALRPPASTSTTTTTSTTTPTVVATVATPTTAATDGISRPTLSAPVRPTPSATTPSSSTTAPTATTGSLMPTTTAVPPTTVPPPTTTVVAVNRPPSAAADTATTTEDTPVELDVLANDIDADGDVLTARLVGSPNRGAVAVGPDGVARVDPAPDLPDDVTFTYEACDPSGSCVAASVTVTVTPVNDAPTASASGVTTAEDTATTIDVLAGASDADADPLTIAIPEGGAPTSGTATVAPDGTVIYAPATNANGTVSFSVEVCDPTVCTPVVVTVTVTPVHDAPVAASDTAITLEDTSIDVDVLANDDAGDAAFDVATLAVTSGPATVNPAGFVTFTPPSDASGDMAVGYRVCTTLGECVTGTVSVAVTPVNDAPRTAPISVTTAEDSFTTVDVLGVSSDVEGDALALGVSVPIGPTLGTAATQPDGSILYTPHPNMWGTDSFTFSVCDADGACATEVASVTVTAVFDPPVAAADSITTPEDAPVDIDVLANDVAGDDPFDPAAVSVVLGETAVANPDGTITYAPDADWSGTAVVTYQACTTAAVCTTADVTITVAPANDAPVVADDTAATDAATPVRIAVLANDSDIDDGLDPGTLSISTAPASGSASVSGSTVAYTPAASGVHELGYTVCDYAGACATATVTVYVDTPNRPPVAAADYASVDHDTVLVVDVLANDSDPDGNLDRASVRVLTGDLDGATVSVQPNGSIMYDRGGESFHGLDRLTYEVCDTAGLCSISALVIDVYHPESTLPPVAVDDAYTVIEGTAAVLAVTANDSDAEGRFDADTLTIITAPSVGTAVARADGSVLYTAPAGAAGTTSFVYLVRDEKKVSDFATVTITFAARGSSLYLGRSGLVGDVLGADTLPLSTSAPTAASLANYDADRNDDPGLTLKRTSSGFSETSPDKRQRWSMTTVLPMSLSGPTTVEVWAATRAFDDKAGEVAFRLSDCDALMMSCTTVASGLGVWHQSQFGAAFGRVTASLGDVDHTFGIGRQIVLTAVIPNASEQDVWLGFATTAMPAAIVTAI